MTIDLENMKARLENKRAELQASIDELRKEAASSVTALAVEREAQESEDIAADLSGRERERSVFATELMLLMEVQHALKRIAEGTYGRCMVCGQLMYHPKKVGWGSGGEYAGGEGTQKETNEGLRIRECSVRA